MKFSSHFPNRIPLWLERCRMGCQCFINLCKAIVVRAPRLAFSSRKVVCKRAWCLDRLKLGDTGHFPRNGFVPAKRKVIRVHGWTSECLCKWCRKFKGYRRSSAKSRPGIEADADDWVLL